MDKIIFSHPFFISNRLNHFVFPNINVATMEWKNPHDIMRTHKIRRASSDVGLKRTRSTSSISLSRDLSGCGKNEAENIPALHSSKSDMAIYSAQGFGSNKRRNPFSRDSVGSPRKRRSILSNQPCDENSLTGPLSSAEELPSSLSMQQSSSGLLEKETRSESKLIDELNLADCKLVSLFLDLDIYTLEKKFHVETLFVACPRQVGVFRVMIFRKFLSESSCSVSFRFP